MLWSILSAIFGGIWNAILVRFGMSVEQKLGRAEVENSTLKAALKEKTHEAQVFAAPARPESAVDDELRRHASE